MKTRIIHTKIYTDEYYLSLNTKERCLFFTILTNDKIGLSDIYEIPDVVLSFYTGLTLKELSLIKEKFEKDNKFKFYKSYIKIINSSRYQEFTGLKNETAKKKESNLLPNEVKDYFDEYPIDTLSDKHYTVSEISDTPNNHKSVISNKKPEQGVVKGENLQEPETKPPEPPKPIDIFINKFNLLFKAKYQATLGRSDKLKARLKTYTLEQILEAIFNMSQSSFHRGKNDRNWIADPDFLLRSDEMIDKWLNSKTQTVKKQEIPQFPLVQALPPPATKEEIAKMALVREKIRSFLPRMSMEGNKL